MDLLTPTRYVRPALKDVPQREFLCGPTYQRGQVTLTIAAGGVGKTALCLAEAVSMAGGFSVFEDDPMALRVWFISAEEDEDEINRRIAAACAVGGYDQPLGLFVDCVSRDEIQIAGRDGVNTQLVQHLVEQIRGEIDVVVVDPFICTHAVSENDNTQIDKVARAWREIASKGQCAVHLIHHQAKDAREGADGARGASALRDAARFVRTLERLEENDADYEQLGLRKGGRYIRVKVTKSNYHRSDRDHIFELGSVTLQNGVAKNGGPADGDMVSVVLARGKLASKARGRGRAATGPVKSTPPVGRTLPATDVEIDIILNLAAQGLYKAGVSSPEWLGLAVAQALGLDPRIDRSWLVETITKLCDAGRLLERKGPGNTGGGRPPIFLKPVGYSEEAER